MSPDPGSDRRLDADLVRMLLREQFPELADATIEYVAEGYDHQMYQVGEWMFRFPKRAEVVAWGVREVAAMPVIAAAVGVSVPRFEYIGRPSEAFPYPFAGYRRIPGVAADEAECVDLEDVARKLGRALTALHSIDPALIPSAPHADDEPSVWSFRWDDRVVEAIPAGVRDESMAFLRGEIPRPPFSGPTRVVHSDLLPEHVLVDPETGRLTGIIDFADLVIGDPTGDFVGLLEIGGRELVEATLTQYTVPLDEHFFERLRWRLRAYYLHALEEASPSELPEQLELVEIAFTSSFGTA